jgi:hypothetical protein
LTHAPEQSASLEQLLRAQWLSAPHVKLAGQVAATPGVQARGVQRWSDPQVVQRAQSPSEAQPVTHTFCPGQMQLATSVSQIDSGSPPSPWQSRSVWQEFGGT